MNTQSTRIATMIVATVLAGGCQRESVGDAEATLAIQVHVVRTQEIAGQVIASGTIEAIGQADLAFQVPGRVIAVEVEEGTLVQEGQLLARLDPADYEKNLAIAEAQLLEVRARHARLSRMHEAASLTDTDFDKIDAALKQTEAATELARRQLGYTELRAPFAGWLVKHGIEAGVVVAPAMRVFTVRSPGAVWANLGVAEVDMSKVRIGQKADVYVPAASLDAQRGTIAAILPHAETFSRAFTVKVRLDNARRDLRHGNVVVGHILTGDTRRALTVPPQVVQKHPDGSLFVWLFDAARQTAVRQIVEVGVLRTSEVEIAAGLHAGDQVVLNVPHTLFEGARLNIVNAQ